MGLGFYVFLCFLISAGSSEFIEFPAALKVFNASSSDHLTDLRIDGQYADLQFLYVLNLKFGTPSQDLRVIIDSASTHTWVKSRQCKVSGPIQGSMKTFNEDASTSLQKVDCSEIICKQLRAQVCIGIGRRCRFVADYEDDLVASGHLYRDSVVIGGRRVSIVFGLADLVSTRNAAQGRRLLLPDSHGIAGFDRRLVSFISQLKAEVGATLHATCFPNPYSIERDISVSGVVRVGDESLKLPNMDVFRLLPSPFYEVQFNGIFVGGKFISADDASGNAGTLIWDSGSQSTYLERSLYEQVLEEIQEFKDVPRNLNRDYAFDMEGFAPPYEQYFPEILFVMDGKTVKQQFVNTFNEVHGMVFSSFRSGSTNIFGLHSQADMYTVYDPLRQQLSILSDFCKN